MTERLLFTVNFVFLIPVTVIINRVPLDINTLSPVVLQGADPCPFFFI